MDTGKFTCEACGKKVNKILGKKVGKAYCVSCYRYFILKGKKQYKKSPRGKFRRGEDGGFICHICGQSHSRIMYHVKAVHDMSSRDYRIKFNLPMMKKYNSEYDQEYERQCRDGKHLVELSKQKKREREKDLQDRLEKLRAKYAEKSGKHGY